MQISYHTNNIPDQSPQIFNAARLIDHNLGRTTNFKASQEALLSHKSQMKLMAIQRFSVPT